MNRALLVGVNDYAKQTGLNGCVNDVVDIKQVLLRRGSFEETDIVVLTDKAATKAAIVDELIELVDALQPGDWGYFHFSGHGVRLPSSEVHEPTGMSEALCPHNFDWTLDTAFNEAELAVILNALRLGARLIVSFDTCHSGDFSRGLGLRGQPRTLTPATRARSRGPTLHGFRAITRAPNVTFIAACSPWQSATETTFDGRPSGAFTHFLLKELAASASTTISDAVAAIEQRLQDYAMTPIAENAGLSYFKTKLPIRSTLIRAGAIVFERRWQTTLLDQPVTIDVQIAAMNGELVATLISRAFGITMVSPPIPVAGSVSYPTHVGVHGVQIVLTISSWAYGRGTIDFVIQLDLVSDRAFVPRTRMPVRIDVTHLNFLHRTQSRQRVLTPVPPSTTGITEVYRDPRVRVVASGIASWGPDWSEDRIIRPFQDRPRPEHVTRTNVPQIGPQRGSGNVFVIGWLSNDETDFDFVLHIGNHFFGGWGDIDWRVEGIVAEGEGQLRERDEGQPGDSVVVRALAARRDPRQLPYNRAARVDPPNPNRGV